METISETTNLAAVCSTRAHGTVSHRRRAKYDKARKDYYCVDNSGNTIWGTNKDSTKREMIVQKKWLGLVKHRYFEIGREESDNLITNPGRIFIHTQCYGTTGLGANGLNYIALSNDSVTETATSTVLSNEITTNGLARAQGTVTLPTGAGTATTIAYTWTASNSQSAQKAALFTAGSGGTMNHVLAFTQRALINTDQMLLTYTISTS